MNANSDTFADSTKAVSVPPPGFHGCSEETIRDGNTTRLCLLVIAAIIHFNSSSNFRKRMRLRALICLAAIVLIASAGESFDDYDDGEGEKLERYPLMRVDFEDVKIPLIIALWLVTASIAKLVFQQVPHLAEMFPDSSLLIMFGLIVGIILNLLNVDKSDFNLNNTVFMLYLLPPLVFDAGYFMPARQFFDNLGSILCFAMVGTTFNIVAISMSLWAVSLTGLFSVQMNVVELLLFGSVAADVDPVAVIVIFEELGVNDLLFISVFGESLLNDGISVVFYNIFNAFVEIGPENIIAADIVNGFFSFFIVCVGGIAVGLIFAAISAFITKYTERVDVLNPVFVLVIPYMAFLVAEMLSLSSIIAVVFCGAAMKMYVRENMPERSSSAIAYFIKVLSLSSETVIFVFLGLSTVSSDHHWDTSFIVLTVVFCFVYRTLGVVIQCHFLNKFRLKKYTKVDQFIMAYGGLRGAIAYGLAVALPAIPAKPMFVTCTIIIIYFTVFLQGMTLKPIVQFLQVEKKIEHEKTMTECIYQELIDLTMVGMADISGQKGHNWIRETFQSFNNNYIKRVLLKKEALRNLDNTKIVRKYRKMQLQDADDLAKGTVDFSNNQILINALLEHVRTASVSEVRPYSFSNASDIVVKQVIEQHGIRDYDEMNRVRRMTDSAEVRVQIVLPNYDTIV